MAIPGKLKKQSQPLSVHLLVSIGDFKSQPFSSSKLATHYAKQLLSTSTSHDSASSGALNPTICLHTRDFDLAHLRCFYQKVTLYQDDCLRYCLEYKNIAQLDLISNRLDTVLSVRLIKHCSATLVSLSVVYSKEPDNIGQLFAQIASCTKLNQLTFELLNCPGFVSLHERIPNSIGSVDSIHLTFPTLTLELIRLLNSLNSGSISLNTVGPFDLPPLQTNLNPVAMAKIRALPLIHPRLGTIPNLSQTFPNLQEVSLDCTPFVQPDSISPLIAQLASLTQLKSISFANVTHRSLVITKPCTLVPIESVLKVTIRFSNGIVSVGHDVFISELWATVLSSTNKMAIQNFPTRCSENCRKRVNCQEKHLRLLRDQLPECNNEGDIAIEEF